MERFRTCVWPPKHTHNKWRQFFSVRRSLHMCPCMGFGNKRQVMTGATVVVEVLPASVDTVRCCCCCREGVRCRHLPLRNPQPTLMRNNQLGRQWLLENCSWPGWSGLKGFAPNVPPTPPIPLPIPPNSPISPHFPPFPLIPPHLWCMVKGDYTPWFLDIESAENEAGNPTMRPEPENKITMKKGCYPQLWGKNTFA